MAMELDDIKELVEAFLAETDEVILSLESHFIELEQRSETESVSFGSIQPILRPLHTFKGNAGMLGMQNVAALVHALEEIIKRDVRADRELMRTLFLMLDDLKIGLNAIRNGAEDAIELQDWVAFLAGIVDMAPAMQGAKPKEKVKPDKGKSTLPAFGFADDLIAQEKSVESEVVLPTPSEDSVQLLDPTLRITTDKLDQLQREVGELILAFNATRDYLTGQASAARDKSATRELNDRVDRLANRVRRVQAQTTKIRLLGLSAILRRVPRIVRDAAARTGKKVQVVIDGEATEADKTVVDELSEVIVHLVRNAVDHGIEPADVRKQRGKSDTGLVIVRAAGKGDHIQIEVEDDGYGVDVEKVRLKATERGVVSADEARLADRETVLRWIFISGFSTRDATTELSGRGVGLDIVDRTVRSLGGTVRLESALGEGSKFVLSVPISTAVAELLHVAVAGNTLSVPMRRIVETQRYATANVSTPGGTPRYRWRGELIPMLELDSFLNGEPEEKNYVMVLEQSGGALCVPVARFQGKSQAVLHPLGDTLLQNGPFSGATVLGSGYVSLIIDPDRLYKYVSAAIGLG